MPAGPLAVRWIAYDVPTIRAGAASAVELELENAGSVSWQARPGTGVGYHWLDPFGNAIVWDGLVAPLPKTVEPNERLNVAATVVGPAPPGKYRLAFDLVDGDRCWFVDVGNRTLELDVEVLSRLPARKLAVQIADGRSDLVAVTEAALAEQEEALHDDGEATAFLVPGCRPAPDWTRRVLDAHEEGFGAVAGSVEVVGGWLDRRRLGAELAPWSPGFGRSPGWDRELLCPSLVRGLAETVRWSEPVAGLPAVAPPGFPESSLCDGRIRMLVVATALRRGDRRSA